MCVCLLAGLYMMIFMKLVPGTSFCKRPIIASQEEARVEKKKIFLFPLSGGGSSLQSGEHG